MATVYYDDDADLGLVQSRKIAVLGYGSQGHAHALCLKDSGCEVRVSLAEGSRSRAKAEAAGLEVLTPAEAAGWADLIMVLVPDTVQRHLYASDIAPNLRPGDALFFAHGFNIHFAYVKPPEGVDVAMVAPKGPGHLVRRQFEEGQGTPCLVAVSQDATGKAWDLAKSYARGIGGTRAGALVTTFQEETETDLFGDYTRGPRVINDAVRAEMERILSEIRSGAFARELVAEDDAGRPNFNRLRAEARDQQIEQVGRPLRAMMSWLRQPED